MVPGNYVKVISEPSPKYAEANAEDAPQAVSPAPVAKPEAAAATNKALQIDDALARASRRRGMTDMEMEGEKQLKLKIQELEHELKNSEFRHRAELAELKAEQTRLKAQNKRLEEDNTVLENKALLIESAGSMLGGGGNAEVEEELRQEIETLKEARKNDVQKTSKQWERKMERAQAEIDELQEQVNKATEKERSLQAQLKKAEAQTATGGGGGGSADAAVLARAKEAEKESETLRGEVTKLKEIMGGYLDMIEDLKDELEEAKNGPGAGADPQELEELREQLEQHKSEEERLRKGEQQLLAEVQEAEGKVEEHATQINDLMKTNGALLKVRARADERNVFFKNLFCRNWKRARRSCRRWRQSATGSRPSWTSCVSSSPRQRSRVPAAPRLAAALWSLRRALVRCRTRKSRFRKLWISCALSRATLRLSSTWCGPSLKRSATV